jgi:MFS family permease
MSALEEAENLSSQEDEAPPKFPVKDLFILASVRFAEPISFTSINPYVFFLIASFGIAKEDVGIYAGILFATFPLAEFATSLFWVRLSNKIGRRPVVLMGLAGCILPTLMFGYSKSVVEAMIWRTLSGLINGNAPVIATACAEMVTYKPYQARAFSVMPVTWSIGSVLGPLLGGSLSDPVEQYPSLFQDDTVLRRFFLKHRFSLPSTVNAVLFLITLIVAYFALKEPSAPVYLADRSIINERSHLLPRSSSSDSITS